MQRDVHRRTLLRCDASSLRFALFQRRPDDNKNKICALRGWALEAERTIVPKSAVFSLETPRQSSFERANVIVEKFVVTAQAPTLAAETHCDVDHNANIPASAMP